MSQSRFVPFMVLLATAGCSFYHAEVLSIDASPRVPAPADSVRVLAQEPAQTYKVLALVSVQYDWGKGTLPELSQELRQQAAKLGGNGVLIGPASISETEDSRRMTGRVILFDSIAPPLLPTARVPSNAGRIIMGSILAASIVVPGIIALASN